MSLLLLDEELMEVDMPSGKRKTLRKLGVQGARASIKGLHVSIAGLVVSILGVIVGFFGLVIPVWNIRDGIDSQGRNIFVALRETPGTHYFSALVTSETERKNVLATRAGWIRAKMSWGEQTQWEVGTPAWVDWQTRTLYVTDREGEKREFTTDPETVAIVHAGTEEKKVGLRSVGIIGKTVAVVYREGVPGAPPRAEAVHVFP